MNQQSTWDEWLIAEDSASILAPKNFDHEAAMIGLKDLRPRIVAALDDYEVAVGSPELYQDSTGFWIVVSRDGTRSPIRDSGRVMIAKE
jgi:hypothetical protein